MEPSTRESVDTRVATSFSLDFMAFDHDAVHIHACHRVDSTLVAAGSSRCPHAAILDLNQWLECLLFTRIGW